MLYAVPPWSSVTDSIPCNTAFKFSCDIDISSCSSCFIPAFSFIRFCISSFGTSVPSEFIIFSTIVGCILFPPFANILIYLAICTSENEL